MLTIVSIWCVTEVFSARGITPTQTLTVATSSATDLGKGRLLVASRELRDPNFAEAVVLLLDYNAQGALGVIINRPTKIALAEILPEVKALKKRKDVAHLGGPVAQQQLMLLARTTKPPPQARPVFADIYLLSQQQELEHVLQSGGKQTKLRAYVGYAGWAAGQLDREVAAGGWHVVPGDQSLIFDKAAPGIWSELIRRGAAQWTAQQRPRFAEVAR